MLIVSFICTSTMAAGTVTQKDDALAPYSKVKMADAGQDDEDKNTGLRSPGSFQAERDGFVRSYLAKAAATLVALEIEGLHDALSEGLLTLRDIERHLVERLLAGGLRNTYSKIDIAVLVAQIHNQFAMQTIGMGHPAGISRASASGDMDAGAPELPEKIARKFQQGSIYDQAVVDRERAASSDTPTVAISINRVIANFDAASEKYVLRNGIIEQLASLKANGIRVVLWSHAKMQSVEQLMLDNPELAQYTDLIITNENFYYTLSPGSRRYGAPYQESDHMRAIRSVYSRCGADDDLAAKFYMECLMPKDCALLGYKLLVDDTAVAVKYTGSPLAATNPFIVLNGSGYAAGTAEGDGTLDHLAENIMQALASVPESTAVTVDSAPAAPEVVAGEMPAPRREAEEPQRPAVREPFVVTADNIGQFLGMISNWRSELITQDNWRRVAVIAGEAEEAGTRRLAVKVLAKFVRTSPAEFTGETHVSSFISILRDTEPAVRTETGNILFFIISRMGGMDAPGPFTASNIGLLKSIAEEILERDDANALYSVVKTYNDLLLFSTQPVTISEAADGLRDICKRLEEAQPPATDIKMEMLHQLWGTVESRIGARNMPDEIIAPLARLREALVSLAGSVYADHEAMGRAVPAKIREMSAGITRSPWAPSYVRQRPGRSFRSSATGSPQEGEMDAVARIAADSTEPDIAGLSWTLKTLLMDRVAEKDGVVIIAYDTALAHEEEGVKVARAADVAINKYLKGRVIEIRATGTNLADAIEAERSKLSGRVTDVPVVTIASDGTMADISRAGSGYDIKKLGAVINVDVAGGRYVPIAGLYDLALRIAYKMGDEKILECLNRIAYKDGGGPFLADDIGRFLRDGIIRILPRIEKVDGKAAREAYAAAQAALRSL